MESLRGVVIAVALAVGVALIVGCEKGPAQKVGERVDRAVDQDRVFSKGPVENLILRIQASVHRRSLGQRC